MNSSSNIGFGTWPIGGRAYGPLSESDAKASLTTANLLGVDFFDTADIYGNGRAESILGETVCSKRGVRIATKAGYLDEDGTQQDFSEKHLVSAVERSLTRLRRPFVDLLLLHSPPIEVLDNAETARSLNRICSSGLARSWGVSLRNVHHYARALSYSDCSAVEVIINLLDQRAIDTGLLKAALALNVDVIARVPLCFGFLTGKHKVGSFFSRNDHRAKWPLSQRNRWLNAAERFRVLEKPNRTLTQTAIAFCLGLPGVTTVIPGMKNEGQVRHNIEAGLTGARFDDMEMESARRIWNELKWVIPV